MDNTLAHGRASLFGWASLCGALTGLLYGLFEYVIVILMPLVVWRWSLPPHHWAWETEFLAVYCILGAIIGAFTTFFRTRNPLRTANRAVVAVTLLSLAALHFRARPLTLGNLVFDLSLALLAVCSVAVPTRQTWLSSMGSIWVAIPLALILIKMKDTSSDTLAILGVWTGVVLTVRMLSPVEFIRRARHVGFLPMGAAVSAILLVIYASLGLFLDAPPRLPPPRAAASSSTRPNVVLIVLDTVRADHLSLYGYPRLTTPNLDRLAQDGVLFRNAISTSDITLSSHASMFTGLNTSWHGAHPEGAAKPGRLGSMFPTLAGTLTANGYETLAVVANTAYLLPEFGLNRGFHFYDARPSLRKNGYTGRGTEYYLRPAVRPLLELFTCTAELDRVYRAANQITDDGLRVLQAMRGRKTPFFLNLNYMDAHDPYVPPQPFRGVSAGRNCAADNRSVHTLREDLARHTRTQSDATAELAQITSRYDGGIAFMDAQVGRLLDAMKQTGLYRDSLIIITSDHGEGLGERGVQGHPASVHRELVHVPLWIKYPQSNSLPSARQIDSLVSGVDLMPTVLDVAGIPIPTGLQGQSLYHLAFDPHRALVTESFVYDSLSKLRGRHDSGQRALYQDSWKFIATTTGQKELYDWSADPDESRDVYHANPDVAHQLDEQLEQWMHLAPHHKVQSTQANPETIERLKGLGYIE